MKVIGIVLYIAAVLVYSPGAMRQSIPRTLREVGVGKVKAGRSLRVGGRLFWELVLVSVQQLAACRLYRARCFVVWNEVELLSSPAYIVFGGVAIVSRCRLGEESWRIRFVCSVLSYSMQRKSLIHVEEERDRRVHIKVYCYRFCSYGVVAICPHPYISATSRPKVQSDAMSK